MRATHWSNAMRALLAIFMLAACTEAPAVVSTYSTTIECGWDATEVSYQDHIIYRDQRGHVVGQSDAAGECSPGHAKQPQ